MRGRALPLKLVVAAAVLALAQAIVLAGRADLPGLLEVQRTAAVAPKASPVMPGESALAIPVQGVAPAQLSDTFNDARAQGGRSHDAIDIIAPRGTPVLAAAPGRVEKLFLSGEGGTTVYVRSLDRARIYYYAHLDRYAPGLREGMAIRRGQTLGTVGSTGNANPDAPHLHFAILATSPEAEWWDEARALNPYPLLTRR